MMTARFLGMGRAASYVKSKGVKLGAAQFAEVPQLFGSKPVPPEQAIEWIRGRVPLPLKRLEKLLDQTREKASYLTKDLVDTISEKIDERLAQATKAGSTMRDFQKDIDSILGKAGLTKENPFYWETVFRNNVGTAYEAGRREIFERDEVDAAFGYYQYLTVEDSAVRPEHAALDGIVWRADAPEVQRYWPPLGHNCRCTMVPVSKEEIDDEGLKVSTKAPMLSAGHKKLGLPPPKKNVRVQPDKGWAGDPRKRFKQKNP